MLINKEAELVSEWWPHELKIDLFVQLTQIMVSTKMKNTFVYYIVLEGSITYAIHQTSISLLHLYFFCFALTSSSPRHQHTIIDGSENFTLKFFLYSVFLFLH